MQALIINEFGTDLRLDHECLVVIDKDRNIQKKIPLQNLEMVMLHCISKLGDFSCFRSKMILLSCLLI
jgi:hypothetical protein